MDKNLRGNPFKHIYVPDPKQIFEKAIKRARMISIPKIKDKFTQHKVLLINRINTMRQVILSNFSNLLREFPNINSLHEFYRAILNVFSTTDICKKQLGRIQGVIRVIEKLSERYRENIRKIHKTKYITEKDALKHIWRLWKQYVARVSDIIEEVSDAFLYIKELLKKLKKLPDYDPTLPCVVTTGPPNSGKSSFVAKVSNAKVQIASYPFTTKDIVFGHIEFKNEPIPLVVQIVDTPGLFDRPIHMRKKEELLALEAIRTIADAVVFLFDGSTERVLEANEQLSIYETVKNFFKNSSRIIICINKIDIKDDTLINKLTNHIEKHEKKIPLLISVKTCEGLDEVLKQIYSIVKTCVKNAH